MSSIPNGCLPPEKLSGTLQVEHIRALHDTRLLMHVEEGQIENCMVDGRQV